MTELTARARTFQVRPWNDYMATLFNARDSTSVSAEMLRPAMTNAEEGLLRLILSSAVNYVEFGCGGSTVVAAQFVSGSITVVDSSRQWLDKVLSQCFPLVPNAVFADLGPVGDWGYPLYEDKRDLWPSYHERVWDVSAAVEADTFLIDGRFRVACFMQVLLRSKASSLIMIHDFARENYHVVSRFAQQIVRVDELAVFRRSAHFDRNAALACLSEHALSAG